MLGAHCLGSWARPRTSESQIETNETKKISFQVLLPLIPASARSDARVPPPPPPPPSPSERDRDGSAPLSASDNKQSEVASSAYPRC